MIIKNLLKYSYIILSLLFLGCASVIAPSGGPKDNTPPQIKQITPKNNSTNFNSKEIIFLFDEFLSLKNINNEFFSSPPLDEKPEIKTKGKELILKFESELKPNSTYCLNFGKAIADLNEGNSINDFKYSFSTGETIDSLKISGKVSDAFTKNTEENILVLLYKNLSDTAPQKVKPDYIAKTQKSGIFELTNIAEGTYKIYALKDANSNLIFDLPNEKFAFFDTLIIPRAEIIEKFDSLKTDSLISKTINYYPNKINLNLFEPDYKKQGIAKQERKIQDKCILHFNKAFDSKPDFHLIETEGIYVNEFSQNYDTLICWLSDSSLINKDTLRFALNYSYKNPYDSLITINDSLRFVYSAPRKNIISQPDTIFLPKINFVNTGVLHFNNNIILDFEKPVFKINTDSIYLFLIKDSIKIKQNFSTTLDSINPKRIQLSSILSPGNNYVLKLDSGAFENYFNIKSSSFEKGFITPKIDDYVNLSFDIKNNESNIIIQLLNAKQEVINQMFTSENEKITFKNIKPLNYKVKVIIDENNNKIWDTGNYNLKKHAEKVFFYEKDINLKPNFDQELELNINDLNK